MDQSKPQIPILSTFHNLFNLMVKGLTTIALKPLTLFPLSRVLGICDKFFGFLVQGLAGYAVKNITLGHSAGEGLVLKPHPDASSEVEVETKRVQDMETSSDFGKKPEEGAPANTSEPRARGPKKMVSINDRVEEIYPIKNQKKRKIGSEKLLFIKGEYEDNPRPLRSILRVGSNLKG